MAYVKKKIKQKPGPKRQYPDPEAFKDKIDAYFRSKRPVKSLGGLCDYLDLTYEGLDKYGRREEYAEIVRKAKQRVSTWLNEAALAGKVNPTVAIFNQKCNFHWKENKVDTNNDRNDDLKVVIEVENGRKKG